MKTERKNWIKMYWEDIKISTLLRMSIAVIVLSILISMFYNSIIVLNLEFLIGWIGVYFFFIIGILLLCILSWLVIVMVAEYLNKGKNWLILIQEVRERNKKEGKRNAV